MARQRPQDEAALAKLSGFGATRAAKYGAELLPLLRDEG